jgi:hypothetical protein
VRDEVNVLRAELRAVRGNATEVERGYRDHGSERQSKRARVEDEVADGDATFTEFTNGGSQ